jgi:hypothetical protein
MHNLQATSTISSREELMGAIATVDELVVRAVRLTRTAQVLMRTAEDVARTVQDLQGASLLTVLLLFFLTIYPSPTPPPPRPPE